MLSSSFFEFFKFNFLFFVTIAARHHFQRFLLVDYTTL
nr:MAG TPA: hypothetical protein [Caudoviricetes sp.]